MSPVRGFRKRLKLKNESGEQKLVTSNGMSEKKRLVILLILLIAQISFIVFTRVAYQRAFN